MDKFIVAEITRNWGGESELGPLISQKFEMVISINTKRGYKLIDWKFTTTLMGEVLTETIIAIFELEQ